MDEFDVLEVTRTARKVLLPPSQKKHLPGSFNSPSLPDLGEQQPNVAFPVGKRGQTPMTVLTVASLLACNKQVSTRAWWRPLHESARLNGRTQGSEQRSLTDMELQVKTQHCRNVCTSAAPLPPTEIRRDLKLSSTEAPGQAVNVPV